jgi:hypothetical protein
MLNPLPSKAIFCLDAAIFRQSSKEYIFSAIVVFLRRRYAPHLSMERIGIPGKISMPSGEHKSAYEHPVVLPHVSHFMHVPFRTSVKFPHSPQASPS